MDKKITILFFLEGRNVPASRFRAAQFFPLLREEGISFKACYTFPEKYKLYPRGLAFFGLRHLFALASSCLIAITRLIQILLYARRAKVIFLQRDFMFRMPSAFLERFLFRWIDSSNCSVVFDVDDAIFLDRMGKRDSVAEQKISYIARNSRSVIVGNEFLRDFFVREARQVHIIPTVVDTARFLSEKKKVEGKPVVGWIGQRSNFAYLTKVLPALEQVAQEYPFTFHIVAEPDSRSPVQSRNFSIEMKAWSADEEVRLIDAFDIGIMPLEQSEWEEGKCGFKLIQYMALGKAAIASPVGVNAHIAADGECALLASSNDEWIDCLKRLLSDEALRARLGASGRKRVQEYFSIRSVYNDWRDILLGPTKGNGQAS